MTKKIAKDPLSARSGGWRTNYYQVLTLRILNMAKKIRLKCEPPANHYFFICV